MKSSLDDRKEREYLDACLKEELRRLTPEQIEQVAIFISLIHPTNDTINNPL